MGFLSVLSFAHQLVQQRVQAGDMAIDATAGCGNDTLLLCRLVGASGRVVAFDIQPEALEQTQVRLAAAGMDPCRYRLVLASHHEMEAYVKAEDRLGKIDGRDAGVAAVMFNLGYLPGDGSAADESDGERIITRPDTTIPAMEAALRLLRPGGVLTAVLYPGHSGGREEAEAVEAWAAGLPQRAAQTLRYSFTNAPATAPYLVAVEKKSSREYNR
ncbi:class I SAM-dependent methyltransferase [Paenibacillus chartarius]|uniref:Class I SAM-dependent methyltransferase n=1 Tax=Paenibacillus chartarius TaxID=747481 RepID=A0ABV6DPE0_9BACL